MTLAACRPAATTIDPPRGVWSYEVAPTADGRELRIQATLPPTGARLHVDDAAAPFVRDVLVASDGGWKAAPAKLPCAGGCTLRYRFLLDAAARGANDADVAEDFGGAFVSPASAWALHPADATALDVRFHGVGPGLFLSGAPPAKDAPAAAFASPDAGLEDAAYSAFGNWRVRTIDVSGQTVTVGIAPTPARRSMDDDALTAWVRASAEPLAAYFGRLAAARPLVLIVPGEGGSIDGKTLGGGGASVLLHVGPEVTAADAAASWVVTHELVHANLPSFGYPHAWFEEGIATYVEPIARIRAKTLARDSMWRDLIEHGPSGLPEKDDRGLEATHTWGRTYWGGALFCLAADIAIRQKTRGTRSLDDALRAIASLGPGVAIQAELARAIALGDAATGTTVLRDAYRDLAAAPGRIDLDAQWRALGIRARRGGGVEYDDRAPLASIRDAITGR